MAFRPLLYPLFIVSFFGYLFVRLSRLGYYGIPEWANSYLSDVFCMPIILTLCLVGVRVIKRIPNYRLSVPMIYLMTTFYAVFFEWYLPSQSIRYTQDPWDVLMYFLGATAFFVVFRLRKQ